MKSRISLSLLFAILMVAQFGMGKAVLAAAFPVTEASLTNRYSDCSWEYRPGNGGVIAHLRVGFKKTHFTDKDYGIFLSRAILVYSYDKNGKMVPIPLDGVGVEIGSVMDTHEYKTDGYSAFYAPVRIFWVREDEFEIDVKVWMTAQIIKEWKAITVRAGNMYLKGMYMEMTGGAYIYENQEPSTCKIVDPIFPPEPEISINMTAPDWDLGELPVGEGQKVFTGKKDQLCLTYPASMVKSKKFIIYATNSNGVVDNKFQLKNVEDAGQVVPYFVNMISGVGSFDLPNKNYSAVELNSSGETCFVPVFNTSVGKSLKEGSYSDVMTFNVITKP